MALYRITHGPVPVRGPGVEDRWFKRYLSQRFGRLSPQDEIISAVSSEYFIPIWTDLEPPPHPLTPSLPPLAPGHLWCKGITPTLSLSLSPSCWSQIPNLILNPSIFHVGIFNYGFFFFFFCSRMSSFMGGGQYWHVIERQFKGELTFKRSTGQTAPRWPAVTKLLSELSGPPSAQMAVENIRTDLWISSTKKSFRNLKNSRRVGFIWAPLSVLLLRAPSLRLSTSQSTQLAAGFNGIFEGFWNRLFHQNWQKCITEKKKMKYLIWKSTMQSGLFVRLV